MSDLFSSLLTATSEEQVTELLGALEEKPSLATWHPLIIGKGDGASNESNYSVIENQQASPVGALIEKITNSIDAILMRKCYEAGIGPKDPTAPQTMTEAIERFFSPSCKNWHLQAVRKDQAEAIQIVATGSTKRPCLLIYDDGEGQHPQNFEQTFLSILRGNKNEIPFVQGKYNMGGTGAIVFCGHHRYQLIGSRRYDGSGDFGFTLVRRHPLSETEQLTRKNTWYEYLKIDGKIPSFPITEIDLGLANRKFKTGTLIKLYDYDLPAGTRGALPQEGRRAIDQHLFEPALPIYLVDTKERYPNNKVLQIDCFGLKRRLEHENKYVEKTFSVTSDEHDLGRLKVTCYVFKSKAEGQTVKETKDNIQTQFVHDGMSVLFSLNGQVHGHFSTEFITFALKMQLLKHHLLIHVDCTGLNYSFRNELFMASRDRLKSGDETNILRKRVASILLKSELVDLYNERKNAISVESGDAQDLLRAFSKNLPFNKDLMRLLNQTFKIDQGGDDKKKTEPQKPKMQKVKEPFHSQRYPSFFRLKRNDEHTFLTIPERDEKTIQFSTDVENGYFDRVDDPGDLKISILQFRRNDTTGGTDKGPVDAPGSLLDVRKSSPKEGTIRIGFGATEALRSGDELEVKAVLGGPEDHEARFWVKIVDPQAKPKETEKPVKDEEPPMGLPSYVLVYQEKPADQSTAKTWSEIEGAGISMDWEVVMYPLVDESTQLTAVYINMDSRVLRNFKSKQGNLSPEQAETADKRFISSVYFHTIFLYSITKSRHYELKKNGQDTDLPDYLRDVFSSPYSDFLLNFGMEQLIASLSD